MTFFINIACHSQNCNVKGGNISSTSNKEICAGDGLPDIFNISLTGHQGSRSVWLIVNLQDIIVSRLPGPPFNFESSGPGNFRIYHVAHDGSLQNSSPGSPLQELTGCYSLSNSIPFKVERVDGGLLYDQTNKNRKDLCADGLPYNIELKVFDKNGQNGRFIVVDESDQILQISSHHVLAIPTHNPGSFRIYYIGYNSLSGLFLGSSLQQLSGCFSLSNPYFIDIIGQDKGAGVLSTSSSSTFCSGIQHEFNMSLNVSGAIGSHHLFIITSHDGNILEIQYQEQFTINIPDITPLHIYHISYLEGIKNLKTGSNIHDLEGCFHLSNRLVLTQNFVNGGKITFSNGDTIKSICQGEQNLMLPIKREGNKGNTSRYFVLDDQDKISIVFASNVQNIDTRFFDPGAYKIYNISYNGQISNLGVGRTLDQLSGCFALSNPIALYKNEGHPAGGQISATQNTIVCANSSGNSFIDFQLTGAGPYHSAWLITNTEGKISDISYSLPLDFSGASTGECLIYHINFHSGIQNLETGKKLSELIGCYDLSNSITIFKNAVFGGNIRFDFNKTELLYCTFGAGPHLPNVWLQNHYGDERKWIYTDNRGIILNIRDSFDIDVRSIPFSENHIYHISYTGTLQGLGTGSNISHLNGCFSLSNKLVLLKSNLPTEASTISSNHTRFLCKGNESLDIVNFEIAGGQGDLSSWIITDEEGMIIRIQSTPQVNFETLEGHYFIVRNIKYYSNILGLETGNTISGIQGCYSLSNAIFFERDFITNAQISFVNSSQSEVLLCLNGNPVFPLQFNVQNHSGDSTMLLVTNPQGIILDFITDNTYQFLNRDETELEVKAITFSNNFDAPVIGDQISHYQGCYNISNTLSIYKELLFSGLATTIDGVTEVDICSGNGLPDVYSFVVDQAIGSDGTWVLTDADENIIRLQTDHVFDFEGLTIPKAHLRYMMYKNDVDGLFLGNWLGRLRGCYYFSTPVMIHNNLVKGGILGLKTYGNHHTICVQNNSPDILNIELTGNSGQNTRFLLADANDRIIDIFEESVKDFNVYEGGFSRLYAISYSDISGLDKGNFLTSLQGCFALSNPVTIEKLETTGGNIMTNTGETAVDFCVGDGQPDILLTTLAGNKGSFSKWIFTDEAGLIQNVLDSPLFNFDNSSPGVSRIYHISYEAGITGMLAGNHIQNINGCFSLSNNITVNKYQARGGNLSTTNQLTDIQVCLTPSNQPNINVMLQNVRGKFSGWLITNPEGKILETAKSPPFKTGELGAGNFHIYHIRYETQINNATIGHFIHEIIGCYDLSNPIKLNISKVDPAIISLNDQTTEIQFCVDGQPGDPFDIIAQGGRGESIAWIITNETGIILDIQSSSFFDFKNENPGVVFIYLIHYNGQLDNLKTQVNMSQLTGCFSISNPVRVNKITGGQCSTTSILDQSDDEKLSLYPNPASQKIYFNVPDRLKGMTAHVVIFDGSGKRWMQWDRNNQIFTEGIEIQELPEGIFYLQLSTVDMRKTFKFIKIQ
ncbi:MAG TPA: T9SS type A sorting domain-containing protein [Saprospiraceae bacterium]|nr:T9SS type A sorting domain-containing protein [Saprospiraceae bacterium]